MTTLDILGRRLSPREPQRRLSEFIDGAPQPALAVQADTGTGKTAVLVSAAIAGAKAGRRVLISTHTIQLLRQVEAEARRFAEESIGFSVRLGMGNFISPARVRTAWGRRIARGEIGPEDEAGLEALLAFASEGSGLIEEFVNAHGELPASLKAEDIRLLPSARAADKAAWTKARGEVKEADVIIQSHALTLLQARFAALPPVVLFDEADALGEVADSAEDKRLSLSALQPLMELAGIDVSPLTALRNRPADTRLRERLADALKVPSDDEELRFAFASARWILTAHRLDNLRRGTEVLRSGGDVVIRSLWADRARWIWPNLVQAGVERAVFASATLAVGGDVSLSLRRFGVPMSAVAGASFSPVKFGAMSFKVIPAETAAPIRDGEVSTAWREAAAAWLLQQGLMRAGSRPLVLARSYADAAFFAAALGLPSHERGKPLAHYIERFRTGELRGLVTPAGWVGVDLPGLISDVIILRLPYGAVDDLKADLLGRTDFPALKAEMQRKLKQGLGRGIRKEDDAVTAWFADPRVHDMRNGLIAAIPERFRDAFHLALRQVKTRETEVRTEQEKFRERLIAHYGGRCIVTGSQTLAVLEAAHKPGRSWRDGHNRAEDGWLLRADIHKLLDDGLLSIENGTVRVHADAAEYLQYDGQEVLQAIG